MSEQVSILIVDDDVAVRSSLSLLLKRAGFSAVAADGPESAHLICDNEPPALILLDMNFSPSTTGEEGLTLLGELRVKLPDMPIILMTAWGSIPLAVEGMKTGAVDFITKPWNNTRLLQSVRTALSLSHATSPRVEAGSSREALDSQYDFSSIIGVDPALIGILETVGRVAGTDAAVLIEGESGTGKELVAEAIHNNSPYRDEPFVRVNLGGIPPSLFESEMFGHKRGAFTDAVSDRVGRFEAANGGTIFLDEIGELEYSSQIKLLRVLQDHSFEVLGTSTTRSVDVRVICATNRDLTSMVAERTFREDLFYRINLISITLPPLRERPDDIPLLVNFFIDNLKSIYDRPDLNIARAAVNWLESRPWPGNVRQLKNVVERAVLVSPGDIIDTDCLQAQWQQSPGESATIDMPMVGTMTIEEMEQSMIRKALELHGNKISKDARLLGLSRAALYRRLEKYGITP